ncbi:MAG: hypothetical protein COT74_12150 [Bdellovibrionales bacterium CG10_big_fil_rev_8_21_14_0_10_45_34]|nr:MAG: hypothetical protein COT74_12150 [Bdellovibrionales bacterium CG10_big_fil_rev_8_21_14_0_10_45_34]
MQISPRTLKRLGFNRQAKLCQVSFRLFANQSRIEKNAARYSMWTAMLQAVEEIERVGEVFLAKRQSTP